ncbi:thioesterase domain-containing protein, partial [Jeotgalicoccus sp. S0W5]|uniref:thioesterase domain-containing protein n=1 Tax=Jeotgalicoccus sp. S0W5 TaxID=2527874 RepID=UPI001F1101B1
WQEVLEVDRVGLNDNFFELGGNSLKAILLSDRIQKSFDTEMNISLIFKFQTLNLLAKCIDSQNIMESYIINLSNNNNNNKNKNVFCFPPISGYGTIFAKLAKNIKGHNFFGMNYINTKEKIDQYIQEIMNIQKNGPYILLAYSAGCPMVFEVAKKMNKIGLHVSKIIMIDGKPREERIIVNEEELQRVSENSADIFYKFNEEYFSSIEKNKLIKIIRDYHIYLNSLKNTHKIDSAIHLIRSEENKNTEANWHKYTDEFTEYDGKGEHMEMLFYPYVVDNSKVINTILNQLDE